MFAAFAALAAFGALDPLSAPRPLPAPLPPRPDEADPVIAQRRAKAQAKRERKAAKLRALAEQGAIASVVTR